jgi:hypothetical protein
VDNITHFINELHADDLLAEVVATLDNHIAQLQALEIFEMGVLAKLDLL